MRLEPVDLLVPLVADVVPLGENDAVERAGETGRRTTMRVLYGWPVLRTVPVEVPVAEYRVAAPEMKNSSST